MQLKIENRKIEKKKLREIIVSKGDEDKFEEQEITKKETS